MEQTKKCNRCGEIKRVDLFYISKENYGGKTIFYPQSICKVCSIAAVVKRREKIREEKGLVREVPVEDGKKRCKACKEVKDVSDFSPNNVVRNGKTYYGYRPQCKECTGKKQKEKFAAIRANRPATKPCIKCSKETLIDLFVPRRGINDCMNKCPDCCEKERQEKFLAIRSNVNPNDEKVCVCCKTVKKLEDYNRDIKKPDGHKETCKACYKIRRDAKCAKIRANIVTPDSKVCMHCKKEKCSKDFKVNINNLDGLHYICRECDKIRNDLRIARHQTTCIVPERKVCFTCKEEKPAKDFWGDSRATDGLSYNCSSCANKLNKEYILSRGEDYVVASRKRASKYYKEHSDEVKKYQKEYNEKNKGKIAARHLAYDKNRYHTDARYRLTQILRKRLRIALVYQAVNKKSKRTFELLGIPLDDFKDYFESKFTVGMSWDSFLNGEIHIDHIRPCSSFDLTKLEEQEICFHYTNLQPLWAEDNLAKHDSLDWHSEAMSA